MPPLTRRELLKRPHLSRRELARRLGLHPDSISRNLQHGLGSAIAVFDSRGRAVRFWESLSKRWYLAWTCPSQQGGGRRCYSCWLTLEDATAVAEHLADAKHGARGCVECTPQGDLGQGCRPV